MVEPKGGKCPHFYSTLRSSGPLTVALNNVFIACPSASTDPPARGFILFLWSTDGCNVPKRQQWLLPTNHSIVNWIKMWWEMVLMRLYVFLFHLNSLLSVREENFIWAQYIHLQSCGEANGMGFLYSCRLKRPITLLQWVCKFDFLFWELKEINLLQCQLAGKRQRKERNLTTLDLFI